MISLDHETAPIEPGLQAPPPVCLSWASAGGSGLVIGDEMQTLWASALTGSVVGASVAFDLTVAVAEWPELWPAVFTAYDEDRIYDVRVRQKLIDIALGEHRQHGGYDLATLARRLCGIECPKDPEVRLGFWRWRGVPVAEWAPQYREYAEGDAVATLAVYRAQEEGLAEIQRLPILADQHRQCRADFALRLASAWGLRTDAAGVAALREACETRQSELATELSAAGLLRSTEKGVSRCVRVAQARMLEANPKARLTARGCELGLRGARYVSVDAEACADSGDPLLEHYSEYTQLGSLLSGHVVAMERGITTPLHSRFEVLLDTGRTSSSSPNVQNVRRAPGARECFVPRAGWVFVACDYAGAELHTLAQCCVDLFHRSALADALNAGHDPHIGLGARLAHETYEDLAARIAAGDEAAKAWRQMAKPGNFGFPGGMGATGMGRYAKSTYGVILSPAEAEALYVGWAEQWPEVSQSYLGWIRELTAGTGLATIEHFRSGRWRGRVPYCAAANSFFQGLAADGAKAALYAAARACYSPGSALTGCRVVNFIHDEILIEAPEDRASEAAYELSRIMCEAFNRWVPDVPVSAEPVLMRRWTKGAKQIVREGRLQVWTS